MSWLFQDFQRRARFALRNPSYAISSLCREITSADERFLASITGVSWRRIRDFLDEPFRSEFFGRYLKDARASFEGLKIESANLFAKKVLVQYAAVRALQPDVVVETGVANGVSSAYLLFAFFMNNRGALYSVGLSDPQFLPTGKSLGWVVPEKLRSRWKLVTGDSREALPRLLNDIGAIDIFIHDSLHSYEHMLWEYQLAYPHLRKGGLLLSDDALWNSAFADFTAQVAARHAQILRGVGFLRKDASRDS